MALPGLGAAQSWRGGCLRFQAEALGLARDRGSHHGVSLAHSQSPGWKTAHVETELRIHGPVVSADQLPGRQSRQSESRGKCRSHRT